MTEKTRKKALEALAHAHEISAQKLIDETTDKTEKTELLRLFNALGVKIPPKQQNA